MPEPPEHFLPVHRDYRLLLSYRKAEIVFDITFRFCEKFLKKGDRTIDQMVQAARSGKQNIIEGSKAGLTSREMEIIPPPSTAPSLLMGAMRQGLQQVRATDETTPLSRAKPAGTAGMLVFRAVATGAVT